MIGAVYAKQHPEDVLLYVAVGQAVNMQENEKMGFEKARELALAAGNLKDVQKLDAVGEYPPKKLGPDTTKKINTVRKMQQKYGLAMGISKELVSIFSKSPVFKLSDASTMMFKAGKASMPLLDYLLEFDLNSSAPGYEMPICCIHGENDYQTVLPLAIEYFENETAPAKQIHIIKGAGHNTMCDKPEEFTQALAKARAMVE